MALTLGLGRSAGARAVGLALVVVAIEWARALAERGAGPATVLVMAVGGLLLAATAAGLPAATLGLGWDRMPRRLLGGAALTAVLLVPAAVRWGGAPPLSGGVALAAIVIAAGEELAFRGALYAHLEEWGGPAAAVIGSTLAFTAAHVLSHPARFLPAVLGAGLLLGLWRWASRDLVAPILSHSLADLAL